MHEYRRFVQEQMDARGWRQADLVRASGLSRAWVSRILRDDRPRLGQMPDESTMAGLARKFHVSAETVRTAAARAPRGYADDGEALTTDLSAVSIDALLMEIRRRVRGNEDQDTQDPQGDPPANGEAGTRRTPMTVTRPDDHRTPGVDDMLDRVTAEAEQREDEEGPDGPLPFEPHGVRAARDVDGPTQGDLRRRPGKEAGEENQDPGDGWEGA